MRSPLCWWFKNYEQLLTPKQFHTIQLSCLIGLSHNINLGNSSDPIIVMQNFLRLRLWKLHVSLAQSWHLIPADYLIREPFLVLGAGHFFAGGKGTARWLQYPELWCTFLYSRYAHQLSINPAHEINQLMSLLDSK